MRDDADLPLHRLRVLDLSDSRGVLATRLLADLGADVIRVQRAGWTAGDEPAGPRALAWTVRNANKRVVGFDESRDEDARALARLVDGADVIVASGDGASMLPLPPDALLRRCPRVVLVSVSDFGASGPYQGYAGTSAVMAGLAWMLYKAGTPDLPPVLPPGWLIYDIAGATAAFAALTGVHHQLRNGVGQHLDVSVFEAVQQTTDWALPNTVYLRGIGVETDDLRSGSGEAQPVIGCKDGWVRPAVLSVAEWRRMRAWLGDPEELAHPDLDTLTGRIARFHTLIRPRFEALFADLTMIEAAEEGQRRRIPVTPLLRPSDVLGAQQYRELGSFAACRVDDQEGAIASGFWTLAGRRVGYRHGAVAERSLESCDWRRADRIADGADGTRPGRPYEGVRVLDLGVAGAAPEMARLLAEYGADVIRVESPRNPDLLRQLGGPTGLGPSFTSTNRCKRSVGIDLSTAAGSAVLRDLARQADVLVENLAPGTLERLGVGTDELRRVNPGLLTLSSQMMGSRGPWRGWRGYGANTQPPGGLTYLWSYPDLPAPVGSNLAFPDHVVGRLGALVISACLLGRSTGHVELAQAEVVLNLLSEFFLRESIEPGSVGPTGNDSPDGAPWGVFGCRGDERWCVITCRDDADWSNLVRALGDPSWATPDLETVDGRRRRADEISAHLGAWTRERSDREVMAHLQAYGVPAGYMMYPVDIAEDPHLLARNYPIGFEQPGTGYLILEGGAFRSDVLPAPDLSPAPVLGEHTREVAADILRLGGDEIDRLVGTGALFASSEAAQPDGAPPPPGQSGPGHALEDGPSSRRER
ncbi:CoA transferase [Frankia sp. CNm7]|uniref:CoA transferase n=1 Tax=Frankia nepalensis TaxID=1836974 RepID=A0A937RN21_9ACTN|nr:CoA transferase [Frankia nepalensis]MBL7498700.1 CoA transferase [Frankia nepalensis]MBL7512922.1 CoA transferase [Frankia nepalensis]MBL7521656.1 CoA transferase [Frankia nepalensis]MBL7633215.1 CoA transferase [Frankia nepalensis]